MSHSKLLSELSEDRQLFVRKAYNEMANNAAINVSDDENQKTYFLQLVKGNKELSEIEKQYCRERFIYQFELNNAKLKLGEPRECDKCKMTNMLVVCIQNDKEMLRCESIKKTNH